MLCPRRSSPGRKLALRIHADKATGGGPGASVMVEPDQLWGPVRGAARVLSHPVRRSCLRCRKAVGRKVPAGLRPRVSASLGRGTGQGLDFGLSKAQTPSRLRVPIKLGTGLTQWLVARTRSLPCATHAMAVIVQHSATLLRVVRIHQHRLEPVAVAAGEGVQQGGQRVIAFHGGVG